MIRDPVIFFSIVDTFVCIGWLKQLLKWLNTQNKNKVSWEATILKVISNSAGREENRRWLKSLSTFVSRPHLLFLNVHLLREYMTSKDLLYFLHIESTASALFSFAVYIIHVHLI